MAEAIAYFGRTRLIVGVGELAWLCMRWRGFAVLEALIDSGDLEIFLEKEPITALPTSASGGSTALLKMASDRSVRDQFVLTWMRNTEITKANRAAATSFVDRVGTLDVWDQVWATNDADVLDAELVTEVARRQLRRNGVDPGEGTLRFEPDNRAEGAFRVITDLDFPGEIAGTLHTPLGPESVIAALAEARREIFRSADGRTDMWLTDHAMDALDAKLGCLTRRSLEAQKDIEIFEDIVFEKRSIAEAINSGACSAFDLLELIQHQDTRRWKAWLSEQHHDRRLIQEYDRAVFASSSRFQSVKGKVASFGVMQGIGLAVNVLTGGLSAIPQILVQTVAAGAIEAAKERLMVAKPWQPSMWAKGPAADFLKQTAPANGQRVKPALGKFQSTNIGTWPNSPTATPGA